MARQSLGSWLMGNSWDARQRASRYKDHDVGQGWRESKDAVTYDAGEHNFVMGKAYKHIPGFRRDTAPSSIDVDDVDNMEWPVDFEPDYTDKSWRTKLNKWKQPATPMITNIRANPKKGLMIVTFGSNGAQVTYDHVPREVIARLQHIAKSGESLGREFWDIVRYRGNTKGSKYPYWYAKDAAAEATAEKEGMITPQFKDWIDRKIGDILARYQPGALEYERAGPDIKKKITAIEQAYEAEDYITMNKLYRDALALGLIDKGA